MRALRDTLIAFVVIWLAYAILFTVVYGAPAPLVKHKSKSTPDPVAQLYGTELTLEWGSNNPILYAARVSEDGLGACWPASTIRGSSWSWVWESDSGEIIVYERLYGCPDSKPLIWRMKHKGQGVWSTDHGAPFAARLRPSLPGEYTLEGPKW